MLYRLILCLLQVNFFYRKKQKLTEQLMQDEMILSQNIENFEQEMKSSISNSKQNLSTSSDRQSLSQTTIPEVPIAANNNEEKTEMSSLVKVKDFENYVRQAIQSRLLDKQYEVCFNFGFNSELLNCLLDCSENLIFLHSLN